MAMACSYCARCTAMSVSATRVVSSWVCAWATSDFGAAPPSKRCGREPQRFGVGLDGVVEQVLLRIRAAQLEVVVRQFGMQAETGGFQVGRGGLRLFARGVHGAAHAAPEIDFVGQVERQHKVAGRGRLRW